MTFWKEITPSSNPPETPNKSPTSIESFPEQKSPPESHIWMMPTYQESLPNGSGTRKPLSLHGDLSTTSSTCATTTDPTREPLWESTHSLTSTSRLVDHLNYGLFLLLSFIQTLFIPYSHLIHTLSSLIHRLLLCLIHNLLVFDRKMSKFMNKKSRLMDMYYLGVVRKCIKYFMYWRSVSLFYDSSFDSSGWGEEVGVDGVVKLRIERPSD